MGGGLKGWRRADLGELGEASEPDEGGSTGRLSTPQLGGRVGGLHWSPGPVNGRSGGESSCLP